MILKDSNVSIVELIVLDTKAGVWSSTIFSMLLTEESALEVLVAVVAPLASVEVVVFVAMLLLYQF